MPAGMVVRELFTSMGLDVDTASFATADLLVEGIKKGLSLVTNGLQRVGQGFQHMVLGTAEAADRIDELAQQAGVSTDALQELSYAAGFSGVGMDELTFSLAQLAKRGIKDPRAEMLKLADELKAIPNKAKRVEVAMERFGKAGRRMVPILSEGSEKLRTLFSEAPKLSPEAIEAGVKLNDSFDRLKGSFQEIAYLVGAPLFEPLTRVVDRIREWVKANKDLIKQRIEQVLWGIEKAAKAVNKTLEVMGDVLDFAIANWKLFAFVVSGAALAALVAMARQLAINILLHGTLAALAVIGAGRAALAWLAAAWPFIVIAAEIAFVLLVLEDLYQFLTGGESVIGDLVNYAKQYLPEMFSSAWQAVKDFFGGMWETAKAAVLRVKDTIVGVFRDAWASVKQMAVDALSVLPGGATAANFLFGGGASPAASQAAAAGTGAGAAGGITTVSAPITVNATAGMDEAALASAMVKKFDDMLRARVLETKGAL